MTERRLSPLSHAWTLAGLIALAIALVTLTRLMPHWLGMDHPLTEYLWNFTQVPALLLFGVALFPRRGVWLAFLLPLLAMFVSDLVLQATVAKAPMGSWEGRTLIYCTFVVVGCLGFWLRQRRLWIDVLAASLTSSILFYLVTNCAVWLASNPMQAPPVGYPKTLAGLLECYTWALPFFRNELLGNLFYCGLLFGGYRLVERLLSSRQLAEVRVRE